MTGFLRRRRFLGALWVAALAGGFFGLVVVRVVNPAEGRAWPFLFGAFYGTAVLGLIRLFPVARWAYPVLGVLAGPVPLALLLARDGVNADERGGFWLLTALLGLAIGLLECARAQTPAGPCAPAPRVSDPHAKVTADPG